MNFNDQHQNCHPERVSRSPERSEGKHLAAHGETLCGVYPERSEGFRLTDMISKYLGDAC
jgi:hypothetical protein